MSGLRSCLSGSLVKQLRHAAPAAPWAAPSCGRPLRQRAARSPGLGHEPGRATALRRRRQMRQFLAAAVRADSTSRDGFTAPRRTSCPRSAPSRAASSCLRAASTSRASTAASRSSGRRAPSPYATDRWTASPAPPSRRHRGPPPDSARSGSIAAAPRASSTATDAQLPLVVASGRHVGHREQPGGGHLRRRQEACEEPRMLLDACGRRTP